MLITIIKEVAIMSKNSNIKADTKNSNNTNMSHNNTSYKGTTNNRSNQLNPNNSKYQGGKKK